MCPTAGYNISEYEPQLSSCELKPSLPNPQTLSQEITDLETVTMMTREFLHFLGKLSIDS